MISDAFNSIFVRAYLAVKREEGQTFVEYSLIGLFVAVVAILALTTVGGDVKTALNKVAGAFS